jgi:hypothetical protein
MMAEEDDSEDEEGDRVLTGKKRKLNLVPDTDEEEERVPTGKKQKLNLVLDTDEEDLDAVLGDKPLSDDDDFHRRSTPFQITAC